MVTTIFDRTLKVQTYLIAFVVSDFASVSLEKTGGIPYQLYAKPSSIRNGDGDFGLFAGEKILTNQEKYFQTKYSLPKMSQIAMPNFGAVSPNLFKKSRKFISMQLLGCNGKLGYRYLYARCAVI